MGDASDTTAGLASITGAHEADVVDALDLLRAKGLARPEDYPDVGHPVAWELTGSGRDAALEVAQHAARFIRRRP